jgi:regulator of protease activity HflC (stomatin/prohibitin superfamily)
MKSLRKYVIIIIIILIPVLIISNSTFVTLQPGERGVIFRKFSGGLDKDNIFSPGFHMIAPWNDIHVYDVKEQIQDETMNVLNKDGLEIYVDITVRFFPAYNKIGHMHEEFGVDYKNKLVIPEVRSEVRKIMGKYTADEIYSKKRTQVETEIRKSTDSVLFLNNIQMKALLIRSIKLPDKIVQAIENKLEREQEAEAMKYKLDKEQQEAERKRIQAEGIAKYNEIINASLSDRILKQRGIEATIELAKSPNSKVVVVGSGKEGLPLILGQ